MQYIDRMIIIEAKLIKELDKSWLLDCEGDERWFPKSECRFNQEKEELEAPKWMLEQKFPGEKF